MLQSSMARLHGAVFGFAAGKPYADEEKGRFRKEDLKMTSSALGDFATKAFILVLGLVFLLPALYQLGRYAIFRHQAVAVAGIVERPLWGRHMLGGKSLVTFEDTRGKIHEIRSQARIHWFAAPRKGEAVRVLYLAHDPRSAIVDSLFYYLLLPVCFSAVGACFVVGVLKGCRREFRPGRGRATG
jgi:hypothetical protein